MGRSILVIDHEPETERILRAFLDTQGHKNWRVVAARDSDEAMQLFDTQLFGVVLIEFAGGGFDMYDVVRVIRERSGIPIIFLSRQTAEHIKVRALEAGADDYITKPFSVKELWVRIRACQRRAHASPGAEQAVYKFGDIWIDLGARRVWRETKQGVAAPTSGEINLTPTEFALMALFVINVGRILPHEFILKTVWGLETRHSKDYVQAYVHRLRQKLGWDLFANTPGLGYTFTGGVPEK